MEEQKTSDTNEAQTPARRFADLGDDTGWNLKEELIAPGDERD